MPIYPEASQSLKLLKSTAGQSRWPARNAFAWIYRCAGIECLQMRLYYINLITTHGRRVWSMALEGKEDLERFKELGWGLRTWDLWNCNDCDKRFGDDWPARLA